ncbi:MAG: FAD:protein FMN transferase, partial [Candidatus Micrarchaeaceae archaeon]
DMLADMVETFSDIQGFWFSLGGDVIMGGQSETGDRWTVDIEDLRDGHGGMAGTARAPSQKRFAVATSSITQRKGTHNGREWHHIIDPRTNEPAQAVTATASVCTGRLLQADVFASCAIILGKKEALFFAEAKGTQGMLLQGVDGSLVTWGCTRPNSVEVDNKR